MTNMGTLLQLPKIIPIIFHPESLIDKLVSDELRLTSSVGGNICETFVKTDIVINYSNKVVQYLSKNKPKTLIEKNTHARSRDSVKDRSDIDGWLFVKIKS